MTAAVGAGGECYVAWRRITPKLHRAAAAGRASDDGSATGSIVLKPDDIDRAAAELGEARLLHVGDRVSSIAHIKALPGGYRGAGPETRALYDATHIAGLRKAGVPEE